MIKFTKLVEAELARARKNHGQQASYHEGYAILLEEVDELWDEVRKKASHRSHADTLIELVQVAVCAQKMAEDVVIPKIIVKKPVKVKP